MAMLHNCAHNTIKHTAAAAAAATTACACRKYSVTATPVPWENDGDAMAMMSSHAHIMTTDGPLLLLLLLLPPPVPAGSTQLMPHLSPARLMTTMQWQCCPSCAHNTSDTLLPLLLLPPLLVRAGSTGLTLDLCPGRMATTQWQCCTNCAHNKIRHTAAAAAAATTACACRKYSIDAAPVPWENDDDAMAMLYKLRTHKFQALVLDSPVVQYFAAQAEACDLFPVGECDRHKQVVYLASVASILR
jgi:hypothetical protein